MINVREIKLAGSRGALSAPRRNATRLGRQLLPWAVPLLAVVVWQLLSSAGLLAPRVLPAPIKVLSAARDLFANGFLVDIAVSGRRALTGLLIGGSIGFSLGLLTSLTRVGELLFDGTVQMIRNIPHLSLIPLVIVWFGIGEQAKVFLVSLGVFFPIYLNTFHGVRSIDPGLLEMGSVYQLSRWQRFKEIIFPGALPSILVGLRFALGIMWLTLIVAESIAANSGVGYITMNAREFMQTDVMVVGIVLYAFLGRLADVLAKSFERRLLRWHPKYLGR